MSATLLQVRVSRTTGVIYFFNTSLSLSACPLCPCEIEHCASFTRSCDERSLSYIYELSSLISCAIFYGQTGWNLHVEPCARLAHEWPFPFRSLSSTPSSPLAIANAFSRSPITCPCCPSMIQVPEVDRDSFPTYLHDTLSVNTANQTQCSMSFHV